MKTLIQKHFLIISLLILCFSHSSFGQVSWTDKFSIKTNFEIGDFRSYDVSEFYKIDNILLGIHSEVKSTVNFVVIDTADGGSWIRYNVKTNSVTQHRDLSTYLIALLTDGIELLVYAKNGRIKIDSLSYFKTKERISTELDSLNVLLTTDKSYLRTFRYLQTELKKDNGLDLLLTPLSVFNVYYSSQEYKEFRLTGRGMTDDMLGNLLFNGDIASQWKSTSSDNTVTLDYVFTGDPVKAAQYHKPIYEALLADANIKKGKNFFPPEMKYVDSYTFRTKPGRSFPSYLYKKNVSYYLFRTVRKIEMNQTIE